MCSNKCDHLFEFVLVRTTSILNLFEIWVQREGLVIIELLYAENCLLYILGMWPCIHETNRYHVSCTVYRVYTYIHENFLNTRKHIHEIFKSNSIYEKSVIIIVRNIKMKQFHALKISFQVVANSLYFDTRHKELSIFQVSSFLLTTTAYWTAQRN